MKTILLTVLLCLSLMFLVDDARAAEGFKAFRIAKGAVDVSYQFKDLSRHTIHSFYDAEARLWKFAWVRQDFSHDRLGGSGPYAAVNPETWNIVELYEPR